MASKAVYSFETRGKISDLIERTQPTIAHCHNIYHHLSPSILHELKARHVPVVMTLHDLKIACPAYKMLSNNEICERCKGGKFRNLLARRCMKGSLALSGVVWLESTLHRWLGSYTGCVDRFVVPSRFFLEKFVEWGWPREQFAYIPNFIDARTLEPRYAAGERFVYFGRLSEEKGVDTFVTAIAKSGTKGTIVGTGPIEAHLKELVRELGADIEFAGFQTGANLHALVAGAGAIVLSSVWYENAPLSLMEASSLGKPVLGARIGGIPELIREGETGAIFESGSTDDLVRLLGHYQAMNNAEIERQGKNGREWITTQFSSARYIDSISGLYRNILQERR